MCDGRLWCGSSLKFVSAADPKPSWAGQQFNTGEITRPLAGIYLIGRQDGARVYAVYVGEAPDIGSAVTTLSRAVGPLLVDATRIYWRREDAPDLREYIVKTIIERYHPPLNLSETSALTLNGEFPAWRAGRPTLH